MILFGLMVTTARSEGDTSTTATTAGSTTVAAWDTIRDEPSSQCHQSLMIYKQSNRTIQYNEGEGRGRGGGLINLSTRIKKFEGNQVETIGEKKLGVGVVKRMSMGEKGVV